MSTSQPPTATSTPQVTQSAKAAPRHIVPLKRPAAGAAEPSTRNVPPPKTTLGDPSTPSPNPSALNASQSGYHTFPSAYPITYKFMPTAVPPPVTPSGSASDTTRRARNAVAYQLDHRYDPNAAAPQQGQQIPRPNFPPPIVPPAPPGSKKILEQPGNVKISVSQNPKNPKVVRDATGVEKPRDSGYRNYTFAQRVQVLTLMTHQYGGQYIEFVTGVNPKAQARIMSVARSRGFDFIRNPRIDDAYVVDGIRTGRPKGSKTVNRPAKWKKKKRSQGEEEAEGERQTADVDADVDADAEAEAEDEDESYRGQQTNYARNGTSEEHFDGITAHLASIQEYLARADNTGKAP